MYIFLAVILMIFIYILLFKGDFKEENLTKLGQFFGLLGLAIVLIWLLWTWLTGGK